MNDIKILDMIFKDDVKNYKIEIGSGIKKRVVKFISENLNCSKIIIITDENVQKYHLNNLIYTLSELNMEIIYYVIPATEESKDLKYAKEIYELLANNLFSRDDLIIALGGGVVGDLSGFVAATYKRGIYYIQMPTTLLSQVDSSVGGKVAINISQGKNLVGAFYQPNYVLIDTDYLKTMPNRELKNGLGEVIKYAFISSKYLYDLLVKHSLDSINECLNEIIYECCSVKRDIVMVDEYDMGLRMVLNFGHTLAHAIETHYGYAYRHGEAVAMGMYIMAKRTEKFMGLNFKKNPTNNKLLVSELLKSMLLKFELYNERIFNEYSEYVKYVYNDKKFLGDSLNIITVEKVGRASIHQLRADEIDLFFADN